MRRILGVLASAALVAGCFKVTYTDPRMPPNGIHVEGTTRFFLLALVGDERVPVYQLCPGGVSQIQSGLSFGDLVLTVITIGIYTPRSYEIECGGGR